MQCIPAVSPQGCIAQTIYYHSSCIIDKVSDIEWGIWHWYHNVSEPYYHIQLTIKYRKALLNERTENVIIEAMKGFKERYAIEVSHVGFDKNHVQFLCKCLPKYS